MVNASVTYPAQLTMSLVYFIYLTSMRPEDVLKFSITSNIVVTRYVSVPYVSNSTA